MNTISFSYNFFFTHVIPHKYAAQLNKQMNLIRAKFTFFLKWKICLNITTRKRLLP